MSDEKSVPKGRGHWDELISAHLDGVASPEEESLVNRLLRDDAEFCAEYRSLQHLQRILAECRQQLPPAPPSLLEGVMERVREICSPVCSLEEVVEYVDGVASEEVRARIEQRMKSDAVFRQEVLEYQALSGILAQAAVPVGDWFTQSVLSRLAASPVQSEEPKAEPFLVVLLARVLRPTWIPRYGVAALAVALLVSAWAGWFIRGAGDLAFRAAAPAYREPAVSGGQGLMLPGDRADLANQADGFERTVAPSAPAIGLELLHIAWDDFEQLRRTIHAYRKELAKASSPSQEEEPEALRRRSAAVAPAPMVEPYEGTRSAISSSVGLQILPVSGYIGSLVTWEGKDHRLHCAVIVDMEIARETIRVLCQRYNVDLETIQLESASEGASSDRPPATEGELVVLDLPRSAADSLLRDIAERLAAHDQAWLGGGAIMSGAGAGRGRSGEKLAARPAPAEKARRTPPPEPAKKAPVYRGIAMDLPKTRVEPMRRFLSSLEPMRPLLERIMSGTVAHRLAPFRGPWGRPASGVHRLDNADQQTETDQTEERVRVFLYLIGPPERVPEAKHTDKDD